MPTRFETQMNMNSEKISGKNFMPSEPAVRADGAGDELVGDFGHRLETAGNQLPSAPPIINTEISATARNM